MFTHLDGQIKEALVNLKNTPDDGRSDRIHQIMQDLLEKHPDRYTPYMAKKSKRLQIKR